MIRDTLRWAATHGVMRTAIRRQARRGNADAALLLDSELGVDPFAQYERLRAERPFAHGAFSRVTVHHDVCTEVLRSDDLGVANRDSAMPAPVRLALRLAGPPPHPGPIDPPSMLAVDAPEHTRYRRLVTRAFTAKRVAALRGRTEEIAAELLDGLADDSGPVDLVSRYASLLPVTVISEMLGVPTSMREKFLAWGDGAAASLDLGLPRHRWATVQTNVAALNEWMTAHLRRLRAEPGDDLLSGLVSATDDDGSGLSERELVGTALLVLAAGFETTVNLIANGSRLLFDHPDQRERLAADPTLWANAVDEMLRMESPVSRTARRARRDTVLAGREIPAGALVVTVIAAANRDPEVFADPDVFDVGRANARDHVAFSSGIHYCLGAALARMEGEVALRALFERFPHVAPAGDAVRRPTRILRGYEHMPVQPGRTAVTR
ncbi:cytochrome P450 [Actinomycetospora termitidis]|uniref:Cytochrome P450 n=1 Tax=Actinomycetospora termitidis TaxID=3053470 RepID=A0ABT7M2N6_9PSEU|nr:cytochrome P450 [Actinomycetospora sp. Odt1-22]MDL5154923.1 cytochrome P450 [Actinomycetospora sp. Odt1-22]